MTVRVLLIYNIVRREVNDMINSRRTVEKEDNTRCCARCEFLRFKNGSFICGIDGAHMPDNDIITICICDKFKEVKR